MSDSFKIECPHCRASIRVPDRLSGKITSCPGCKKSFAIPKIESATPVASIIEPTLVPPPLPTVSLRPVQGGFEILEESDPFDVDSSDEYVRRLEPHRGTAIIIIGLLGLFMLPFVFGPLAWMWANEDLRKMRSGRMDPEGKGNTEAGRMMGIIATIFAIVVLVFVVIYCAGITALLGIASQQPRRF